MEHTVDTTPFDPINPTPSHIDRLFVSLGPVVELITGAIESADRSEEVLKHVRVGHDHLLMMLDLEIIKADIRDKSIYTAAVDAAKAFLDAK